MYSVHHHQIYFVLFQYRRHVSQSIPTQIANTLLFHILTTGYYIAIDLTTFNLFFPSFVLFFCLRKKQKQIIVTNKKNGVDLKMLLYSSKQGIKLCYKHIRRPLYTIEIRSFGSGHSLFIIESEPERTYVMKNVNDLLVVGSSTSIYFGNKKPRFTTINHRPRERVTYLWYRSNSK